MNRIIKLFTGIMVCLIAGHYTSYASSHREAPLISNDPLADNTDLYVFRSPCDTNNVVIIANYIPFEHPAGGPNYYNFGTDIRYEIHIDNNTATKGDDIVYRFTFDQTNEDPTTFFNIRLGKQNLKDTYKCEKSTDGGRTFQIIISSGVVQNRTVLCADIGLIQLYLLACNGHLFLQLVNGRIDVIELFAWCSICIHQVGQSCSFTKLLLQLRLLHRKLFANKC